MEVIYTGGLPWMWKLELESGDSVYAFKTATDAVNFGIEPQLGEFVDDYDVDEIYEKLYDGFVDDDGRYWLVERWAIEHPDWTRHDAYDFVTDIFASCDKSWDGE